MCRVLTVIAAFLALNLAAVDAIAETPRILHHEIRVRLDPESREVRVEDHFTVDAKKAITFDLAPWLRLVEVRVDGKKIAAERVRDRVRLHAVAAGPREIEVSLQGLVPELPSPDVRAASTGAVANKEASYLPGHSAWMPYTGHDQIEYNLIVEVPTPYRVVATGRLVEEKAAGGTYRASFVSDYPTEPPSIFAGPYVIAERQEKDLRVRTYFHPELVPLAEEYLKVSTAYIHRYAERIGPYPYADFHIVSAPLPVGLGFPNLTYVGRRVLPLPFMRGRSLAHEILHSWWGNGVAVDYTAGNWAEGLTTYLADYALAEERGEEAAHEMRLGWLQNFAALPPERDMPVERFTAKRHDAAQVVGYDKVAFVFRMLEAEVGNAVFVAGLRQFWKDHRFQIAAWSDLQAAFEAAAGRDLAWFFGQWLTRAGAPRIELAETGRRDRDGDGDYRVALTIRQSAPIYRMRLPIVIETSAGFRRHEVILEQTEQTFELVTEQQLLAIHIDPEFDTFRRLLPGESPPIFRDVTLSSETVLVVPTEDGGIAGTAYQLAGRLLQREPKIHQGNWRDLKDVPVLAIGATEDIEALRARMGPFRHAIPIADRGTARAWVDRRTGSEPWLFVSADDAASLEAVLRPLPHYRSQSYVVFEGAKSVKKGLWRARTSPLSYRFGD
jgi:hypothetical protein